MSVSLPTQSSRRSARLSPRRTRSRSPILAKLSPTPPADDGVQNITRKVIRRLEGLGQGHLEHMVDAYPTTSTPDDDTDVPSSNVSDGERESSELDQKLVEQAVLCDDQQVEELVQRHANGTTQHKQKIDWEIPRKLLHSSIGFFTLYLYISESQVSKIVLVLWSSLCIIVPADLLRLRSPRFEHIYERVLGFLMRESEKKSTNGVIWYILGVNFALQFYPRDVATVAILILSWADTAASTIGRLFGPSSPRLPSHFILPHPSLPILRLPLARRKSWAGFGAACVTGTCIALGFWGWIGPMRFAGRELTWDLVHGVKGSTTSGGAGNATLTGWVGLGILSVVAGLISGVAEALDLRSMDDNLTLPIISGGCILGFLKLAGWIGSLWTSSSWQLS